MDILESAIRFDFDEELSYGTLASVGESEWVCAAYYSYGKDDITIRRSAGTPDEAKRLVLDALEAAGVHLVPEREWDTSRQRRAPRPEDR